MRERGGDDMRRYKLDVSPIFEHSVLPDMLVAVRAVAVRKYLNG